MRDPVQRVEVIKRRSAYEADPAAFAEKWLQESNKLAEDIISATTRYPGVAVDDSILHSIAVRSLEAGVDGHRSDIIMLKAAKTIAAMHGRTIVNETDIEEAAELALPHRVRRRPFDDIIALPKKTDRFAKVSQ